MSVCICRLQCLLKGRSCLACLLEDAGTLPVLLGNIPNTLSRIFVCWDGVSRSRVLSTNTRAAVFLGPWDWGSSGGRMLQTSSPARSRLQGIIQAWQIPVFIGSLSAADKTTLIQLTGENARKSVSLACHLTTSRYWSCISSTSLVLDLWGKWKQRLRTMHKRPALQDCYSIALSLPSVKFWPYLGGLELGIYQGPVPFSPKRKCPLYNPMQLQIQLVSAPRWWSQPHCSSLLSRFLEYI